MPKQRPVQQRKEKDEREWTTPDQKAHLLSKQGEYAIARDTKTQAGWLSLELGIYFDLFSTQPITTKESLQHPDWLLNDKRLFEENVSGSKINRNYEHLPLV
jgi:hypothetical protein